MLTWKDTTSYSRDRERIPTTWTAQIPHFRITVTCGHIYYQGKWIMHCEPFFRERELDVASKEEAQAKAIAMVKPLLEAALSALTAPEPRNG